MCIHIFLFVYFLKSASSFCSTLLGSGLFYAFSLSSLCLGLLVICKGKEKEDRNILSERTFGALDIGGV
jgi:hypothetical protein